MQPVKVSVGAAVLWLASWCLLAAGHPSELEDPWQPSSPQSDSANWPHFTKSAPLVPAFTKTPAHKHNTTHHHRHTTTTAPANHTSHPHTTTPRKQTTTRHATTRHATTTRHAATTHPANRTSTAHPTSHPQNTTHEKHPTTHQAATTTPANHTSHAHPTTTTTTPKTTAPRPTKPPGVLVGNYTVKQGSAVCLRAEMGLQLRVRYEDKAKRQVWGAFAVQPNQTNSSGTCSSKTATLKLHFPEGFILFTFQKNETEKTAYLSQVQANLTYGFPQATTEKTFTANNTSLREFSAPLGMSYQCLNRSLDLTEDFHLSALSERIQAFQLQDGKFGEAEVCPEQKRSIVLPVVVGVVLGLLILIVLVAFAVGRWRAHTGYESL
ncbi:macrosialin [Protobothrops mucrosquamatus]|uniref:macrosialin n=1 Tax=Protobothrops mucrosquamatus TaxID=103944 RepID=UPI0010FAF65B|nr:macrosialin [Protobothrops mucrosquamatus]